MSKKSVVPEAKEQLDKMKYEIANSYGINLKKGYNGELTARENGTVGGQMVKKLIDQATGSNNN